MAPIVVACLVFACVFAGALLGLLLRSVLPEQHLGTDSRDVVKLGIGLIATMSALVLSLLVASAKTSYETRRSELTQLAVGIVLLDRMMAHYGPETTEARDGLKRAVGSMVDRIWPSDRSRPAELAPTAAGAEDLYEAIQRLAPQTDSQRWLQSQALKTATDLAQTRWLLFEQGGSSIPMPFLIVLVFWLTILFAGFGVLTPPNATVVATLFVCSLSVAGALFLILELDQPFAGLIEIPGTPMRNALAQLGR